MDKKLIKKIDIGIEEIILITIIIFSVLDFLEILPLLLDYVKKIISWSILGYLIYKAELTKIFFGTRNRTIDLMLIAGYFLLIIKNLINYAAGVISEADSFMASFFQVLLTNSAVFETVSFIAGGILLILIAFYTTINTPIKAPSVMHVIHEEGPPVINLKKIIVRFLTIFILLCAFFVMVFNLMVEWLAISIDASLIFLALLFYIFFFVKHAKQYHPDSIIFKIGNFGEKFYEDFIEHFKYKKTLFLGIGGMLVLHLLTDAGNFIIPYVVGLKDPLYFSQLGPNHSTLYKLIASDFVRIAIFEKISSIFMYLFNVISILLLLITPAILWYLIYKNKIFKVSKWFLGIFFGTLSAFLLMPVFIIESIGSRYIVGVDIMTQSIFSSSTNLFAAFGLSIFIGLLIYFLSFNIKIETAATFFWILISQIFFGIYIYYYFMDIFKYYLQAIPALLLSSQIFTGIFLFIFFAMTILFYVGGFIMFLREIATQLKKHIREA